MKKKAPAKKPARRPARKGGTQLVASAPAKKAPSLKKAPASPSPRLLPRSAFPDAPSYYDYLDWRLAFP